MRAKFINEKFKEESDPIRDMSIGMIKKIEGWLELEDLTQYEINEDGSIDLYMSLFRDGWYRILWYIPEYIKFNIVNGSFKIIHCDNVRSLKGFPYKVTGNVEIYNNGKEFSSKEIERAIPFIGGYLII